VAGRFSEWNAEHPQRWGTKKNARFPNETGRETARRQPGEWGPVRPKTALNSRTGLGERKKFGRHPSTTGVEPEAKSWQVQPKVTGGHKPAGEPVGGLELDDPRLDDPGTRRPWDQTTLGPDDPGTRRPWDQKTLGPDNPGTRRFWRLMTLDFQSHRGRQAVSACTWETVA